MKEDDFVFWCCSIIFFGVVIGAPLTLVIRLIIDGG